jgi:TonB family protein
VIFNNLISLQLTNQTFIDMVKKTIISIVTAFVAIVSVFAQDTVPNYVLSDSVLGHIFNRPSGWFMQGCGGHGSVYMDQNKTIVVDLRNNTRTTTYHDKTVVEDFKNNTKTTTYHIKPVETIKANDNSGVFKSAAHMPSYIDGDSALFNYINSHLRYPPETCSHGKVILQFVVKKDGYIGEIKVARSLGQDMDEEAIKVIKSLNDKGYPPFSPGSNDTGELVDVWYTIPVTFKVQ